MIHARWQMIINMPQFNCVLYAVYLTVSQRTCIALTKWRRCAISLHRTLSTGRWGGMAHLEPWRDSDPGIGVQEHIGSKVTGLLDCGCLKIWNNHPDSKVHGVHLGPAGPRWAPMLAPWTLLSGQLLYKDTATLKWFQVNFTSVCA